VKAIARHAERLGLGLDDLLTAAAGLLDGRLSAESFRTCLQGDVAETAGRIAPIEEEAACIETPCTAPAPAGESSSEQNSATAAADEGASLATGTAEAGGQKPTSDECAAKARKHRDGTKEAMLIDMLRRPEGATIAQIMAATGWQAHTVRGAFAGALKRKRGITVTSEKSEGGERVYRIAG
jgi:hypothetical protein